MLFLKKCTLKYNDHRSGLQKLQSPRYFTWSLRDIGKSFQLAITAPRLNLTGYGTTTAQGCCVYVTPGLLYPNILLLIVGLHYIIFTIL